jgi:transposase
MITLGVDAHKRLHVATALDETGREIGQWRGPNTDVGWLSALRWANTLGAVHQWGIEGAWGYGRGLAQYLVACRDRFTKSIRVGRHSGGDTPGGRARPIR